MHHLKTAFSPTGDRRGGQRFEKRGGCFWLKDREDTIERTCKSPLSETPDDSEKIGTQSYYHGNFLLPTTWKRLESDSSLDPPGKRPAWVKPWLLPCDPVTKACPDCIPEMW